MLFHENSLYQWYMLVHVFYNIMLAKRCNVLLHCLLSCQRPRTQWADQQAHQKPATYGEPAAADWYGY